MYSTNSASKMFILLIAFICLALDFGEAITCYQCKSRELGDECEKPTNDSLLVDCSDLTKVLYPAPDPTQPFTLCRKMVIDVAGENATHRTIRSCGFSNSTRECYNTANPPTKSQVCQCFTDKCNGGITLQVNVAAVLLATTAAIGISLFNNNRKRW